MNISKTIKQALPKNKFVQEVLILGSGTAGSQIILILSAPILTRLYSAEDFGALAVFMALLSTLNIVASLRYELAIPIAKKEEEATHLVALALFITILVVLVTSAVVGFWRRQIATTMGVDSLADFLWLLPLSLLLLSSYKIFEYWAIRIKAFPMLARTKLTQSVSSILIKIVGAALGPFMLIAGEIVSQVLGAISLGNLVFTKHWQFFKAVRPKHIQLVAQRYHKFPVFTTWGGLLNTVSTQLPAILFATFFSPAVAGIYALANRILSLPMRFVGQAIGKVFLSKAAQARREGNINDLVIKIYEKLAKIAMPPALVIAVIGPNLFAWMFGSEWREAGVLAQLMVPMLYCQFILSPLSNLFSILEKQAQGLALQGLMVFTRCTTLMIGAWLEDLRLAVALFSLGSATSYLIFLVCLFKVSNNSFSVIIKPTAKIFFYGLLMITPLAVTTFLEGERWLWSIAIILTAGLLILWYLFILKDNDLTNIN